MIPACVRAALAPLVRQLHALDQEIARSDRTIAAMAPRQRNGAPPDDYSRLGAIVSATILVFSSCPTTAANTSL